MFEKYMVLCANAVKVRQSIEIFRNLHLFNIYLPVILPLGRDSNQVNNLFTIF